MQLVTRTPLAWKNLTHNGRRLAVAVSGVTFAVVLMFMEQGFQNALFDSTVALVRNFTADIVIVSSSRYSLSSSSRFPFHAVLLARGAPDVAQVQPIYVENYLSLFRPPHRTSRPIRVIAADLRQPLFQPTLQEVISRQASLLAAPQTALIDVMSKESIYELDPGRVAGGSPEYVELADKQLQLVGTFQLGTDFANDGTLLMNLENFAHYFPRRDLSSDALAMVDLGLVHCRFGSDPGQVRDQLQRQLGGNVRVYTRQELVDKEIRFWDRSTPIGIIFRVGMIMGFVVGILICYQVLYNDIADHLAEFATLMAMGYGALYFVGIVVRSAVYLALLGFVPGLGISWLLFQGITLWTGLTMNLSRWDIGLTLAFTVAMCILSGLFAVRKLLAADPASLF
ncbi:MAG: ABC transporter [Pirellulaceae bacterium]|nr:ABC transporter [Pirellulaceae bacterium]